MTPPSSAALVRTLRIIHLAFLVAPLVYVLVGYLAVRSRPASEEVPLLLGAALLAVGFVAVMLAYVVPRGPWKRARDLRARDPEAAVAAYQTGMIIHWACFESLAIYGLVYTLAGGSWLASLAGSVAALAFLATARPRPDVI